MRNLYTFITLLLCLQLSAQNCPTGSSTVTSLLAGDSWAQYMWDDGSHNVVFDKFGIGDKDMLAESLSSNPGPGYTGTAYAVSGSEARNWADKAQYPYISNLITALNNNPDVETVVLSIGGNDILAGRPDNGWYHYMDTDVAGSEAVLFSTIRDNTFVIINDVLAVHPDVEFLLSSYDYPNFTTGALFCLVACGMRRDISYSATSPLITDAEINQMMIQVETERISWLDLEPKLFYDNAIGLSHYYYGDGSAAAGTLPLPEQSEPFSANFYGGNPALPTIRSNFRNAFDPIHLAANPYEYKIIHQTMNYFMPKHRQNVTTTIFSNGGSEDGWTNGTTTGTGSVRVGDQNVSNNYAGILSFDTSSIPDDATIESVSFYIIRKGLSNTNPFTSGTLGAPQIDVQSGNFGAANIEGSDKTAAATATDAGCFHGSVSQNQYALRVDLTADGLAAINKTGNTQLRLSFPNTNTGSDYVIFNSGDDVVDSDFSTVGLAEYMNDARPFLDITYTLNTPVELISFNVKPRENKEVLLSWESALEENFFGYDIEHSTDGRIWKLLSFEEGQGQGNYEYLHENAPIGRNYYRLKMVDLDGTYEYSDIRSALIQDSELAVQVFPNPFHQQIQIKGLKADEQVEIRIFDAMGQSLYHRTIQSRSADENYIISMNDELPRGIYVVQVFSNGNIQSFKLNKI